MTERELFLARRQAAQFLAPDPEQPVKTQLTKKPSKPKISKKELLKKLQVNWRRNNLTTVERNIKRSRLGKYRAVVFRKGHKAFSSELFDTIEEARDYRDRIERSFPNTRNATMEGKVVTFDAPPPMEGVNTPKITPQLAPKP